MSLALYPGSRWEPGYEAKVESYCHLASPGNKASSHCKRFICLELGDQHRVQCRTALSILLHLLLLYFLTSPPHFLTQSSLSLSLSLTLHLPALPLLNLSLLLPLPSFPFFSHNSKQSLTTKIWALLVKFVAGPFQPLLLSYQRSLPRLPVPRLEDTCRRVRMIVGYTSYCWHGNSYW